MANYSIKDLETLSGIKAHTIRIWEQRYNLISPQRTSTNIRFYADEDLKFVLNIAFLNKNGVRISQLAQMSREEINKKVNSISADNNENSSHLQTMTMAMMNLDFELFEQILFINVRKNDLENTILNLILPFLEKINLLWVTGSISTVHEQFVHNLFKKKILSATASIPKATTDKTVMLYLMEGEENEIILVIVQYLLKIRGFRVVYLGRNLSLEDLEIANTIKNPSYIFTSISEHHPKISIQEYVYKLMGICPQATILLTGYQVLNLQIDNNQVGIFEDFYDMVYYFDKITK
jgi:MerR family transcriptional regulator, light-induced transcriptional regulator